MKSPDLILQILCYKGKKKKSQTYLWMCCCWL
uniref:Uncharacterized protein n=1 Tax=Anguilla anguilla TaxID=7936 RepID=A0A0E9RYN8_ANGAN